MGSWEPVAALAAREVRKVVAGDAVLVLTAAHEALVSTDAGASFASLGPADCIAAAPDGELYLGGNGLRRSRDGTTWTGGLPADAPPPVPRPSGRMESRRTVGFGVAGGVWLATHVTWMEGYQAGGGPGRPPMTHYGYPGRMELRRSRDHGATWEPVELPAAVAFALGADGVPLAAGAHGLFRIPDGAAPARLSERPFESVAVSGEGTIVAGTGTAAYVSRDAGKRFAAIGTSFVEKGSWGSLQADAYGFHTLVTGPDGAIWGATEREGVFRLADTGTRWTSHNLGLTVIPGKGSREGVRVSSVAVDRRGTVWAATLTHGLFRLA